MTNNSNLIIRERGGLHTRVRLADGVTTRLDKEPPKTFDRWLTLRIYRAAPFGRLEAMPGTLADAADAAVKAGLFHANGKPRYFIGDLDHGTRRIRMAGVTDFHLVEAG